MAEPHRPSLRWWELIVVFVVVLMLLCLFLPAVNHHGPSRRARCMNNQKQLAFALLMYESRHRHFPGYRNHINDDVAGNPVIASWLVMVFAELDQNQLAEAWKDPEVLAADKPVIHWELLTCPNDARDPPSDPRKPWIAYVVNCGKPGDSDTPAHGVFHNHDVDADPVRVSLDYMMQHDGATYTLLVSENIQAGSWTVADEANLGMVWRDSPGGCNRINECKDIGDRLHNLQYARPSSNHPGGVVAAFCDGRQMFLSEKIDYEVYQHLMTPDSSQAGVPGEFDPEDF